MPFQVDAESLKNVFPFHIVFNTQFRLLQAGRSLYKILPSLQEGENILSFFQILRPRTIQNKIENILKNLHSIFILKAQTHALELKGQILYRPEEEVFLFICQPIVKDQITLQEWGIDFQDFALHDSISDFLFLLQANRKTVEDLESFSERLNQQNGELIGLTRSLQETVDRLQASEEEIRQNAEEIKAINEELEKARVYVETQNKSLEAKNQYILDSINYARRIQDSILPPLNEIQEGLGNVFIYFRPKDILSGDFYWFGRKRNKMLITAVDCTGHGVPGSFMSLIAENLLDKIFHEQNITEPDLVLENMHLGVGRILNQAVNNNRDSVDISICVIDTKNKILEYAGARNPLLLVENGKLAVIKADRNSVGGVQTEQESTFTKHIFNIHSSMLFYLFTDGYVDQFGGDNDRKYTKARLLDLIEKTNHLPIQEQKNIFANEIEKWQGTTPQTDDILLIGVSLIDIFN